MIQEEFGEGTDQPLLMLHTEIPAVVGILEQNIKINQNKAMTNKQLKLTQRLFNISVDHWSSCREFCISESSLIHVAIAIWYGNDLNVWIACE